MSNINSKNTKYELAEALIELTKDCDVKDISICSVAFKANMHRNTIYYHFNDMRDLCLWTIHNELTKCVHGPEYFEVRDGIALFFSRFKPLLDFTKKEIGLDSFLDRMRLELLPLLEPLTYGEKINSEEAKKISVDIFIEQILVAYLIHEKPVDMINLIFNSVMPELLRHDLV